MNKLMGTFFTIILIPAYANAVPSKPYDIVHQIVQNASDRDVVAYGTHNDAMIKTPITDVLRAIYAQKHDSDFWSHYTVPNMGGTDALAENCFINFKYDVDTEYRLFCGTVADYKTEYPCVTIRKPIQIQQSGN